MAKFKEILGTEIWQFMLLPVPPKIFHRVELGRIGRKKLDRQSIVGAPDKLTDHSATMTSKAVPYHQDFPADMAQQVFQKLHHLGAANRTGKQTKVKLSPTQPLQAPPHMGGVVFNSAFLLDQIGYPRRRPQLGGIPSGLGSLCKLGLHSSQIGCTE